MADDARPNLKAAQETTDLPAREKRLTVAEFDRMAELGFLKEPGKHELWDGRIMMAPPPGTPHMDADSRLVEALVLALAHAGLLSTYRVVPDGGLEIGKENLRSPDIMVVRLPFDKEKRPTGESVVLVVEVAHSSLTDDLTEKRGKYAAAGIPEYWVVDIAHGLIHPFRNPRAGDYPDCTPLGEGATISPLFAPAITLNVADLV